MPDKKGKRDPSRSQSEENLFVLTNEEMDQAIKSALMAFQAKMEDLVNKKLSAIREKQETQEMN